MLGENTICRIQRASFPNGSDLGSASDVVAAPNVETESGNRAARIAWTSLQPVCDVGLHFHSVFIFDFGHSIAQLASNRRRVDEFEFKFIGANRL
jgi:hypothetical protein